MLIGYDNGATKSVSLIGTGAEWLNSPDGSAAIIDGNPQNRARIRWLSEGSPAITDYIEIRVTVPGSFGEPLRLGALLGRFNIPVGLKVEIYGREVGEVNFDYSLGGNSLTEVVRVYDDGSRSVLWVFDEGLNACDGYAVRIYNDVGGVVYFDSTDYLDIGLVVAQPAIDVPLGAGFEWDLVDPSVSERTITSALRILQRRVYRTQKLPVPLQNQESHFEGALTNSYDYQKLAFTLSGKKYSLIVPMWQDEAQALDMNLVRKQMIYGRIKSLAVRHSGGRYSQNSYEAEECPA